MDATGEAGSELVSGSSRTSNRAAFISEVSDKLRLVSNGEKKLATVPTLINYPILARQLFRGHHNVNHSCGSSASFGGGAVHAGRETFDEKLA